MTLTDTLTFNDLHATPHIIFLVTILLYKYTILKTFKGKASNILDNISINNIIMIYFLLCVEIHLYNCNYCKYKYTFSVHI